MRRPHDHRKQVTIAQRPALTALFVGALFLGGGFPAMAGSISPELSGQMLPPQKAEPETAKPEKDVPIIEYLFIEQDNLEFVDDTPLDSGLMPASGDDPLGLISPAQNPALLKVD